MNEELEAQLLLPTLTFDVDWAPSWVVEEIAGSLIEAGVRSTWFITHEIEALALMREHSALFELGIHPNFQPGSTHGATADEALAHCLALVPEARCVRTHGLMLSTPLLDLILQTTQVRIDVSIFLPRATGVQPVIYERPDGTLIRLPYVWEDDLEMGVSDPEWRIDGVIRRGAGLKIVDLHPLHVAMNAVDLKAYTSVKELLVTPERVDRHLIAEAQRQGEGPAGFLRGTVEILSANGGGLRIGDIADLAVGRVT